LARRPDLYSRLKKEVDELLPNKRPPNIDDFNRLSYTTACIKESLRLHPPVTMVPKRCTKSIILKNHKIPKETIFWINIKAIHKDPEYWPDPLTFNPDRFYDPNLSKHIKTLTFIPFSFGTRRCIGSQFSMVESVMMLARFAQFYDLHWRTGRDSKGEIEERTVITVHPIDSNVEISHRKN